MEKLICGVDLGGTKLAAGLLTVAGEVRDVIVTHDHVGKVGDEIVAVLAETVRALLTRNEIDEHELIGMGVGMAGHLNYHEGIVYTSSNYRGFENYPVKAKIQEFFPYTKIYIDNDANAQAYGEYKFGSSQGYPHNLFITISTGVGAGIIVAGHVFRGISGVAGEIGHTILYPDSDLQCTCGNYGCVMAHSCTLALPHLYRKLLEAGHTTDLDVTIDTVEKTVDGHFLREGLRVGDRISEMVVAESAKNIGILVYNVAEIFNPPAIVLGGGLMKIGPIYKKTIIEKFHSLDRLGIHGTMKILDALLEKDAGLIGAAALTLEDDSWRCCD